MNIYLVRHGQTDVNLANQVQGQLDSHGLNSTGKSQATSLLNFLRQENLSGDILLSSPLKRAAETAAYVAKAFMLDIIFDDRLKEINCGECEGINIDQLHNTVFTPPLVFKNAVTGEDILAYTGKEMRDLYHSARTEHDLIAHPGGETKLVARTRVLEALLDFAQANPQVQNLWAVMHSTSIKLLLNAVAGGHTQDKVECTEIVHFTLENGHLSYKGRLHRL